MKIKVFTLLLSIFVSCLLSLGAQAATYNYYFSNSSSGNPAGNDATGNGTQEKPWSSLSKAQQVINALQGTDIVNLYFDRGDTWSYDSARVSTVNTYGLVVDSTAPIVHIDAYGSGERPIFDGKVANFSTVPVHNATTGPRLWNRFFEFKRNNCSVSNITISRVYGHGILLKNAHFFKLAQSYIHHFGNAAISMDGQYGLHDSIVEYSTVHTGQQLYRYSKAPSWGGGINFAVQFGSGVVQNNYIRHNLVYDIYGEGIIGPGATIEYNIVGDCGSVAIDTPAFGHDYTASIVRNNFIVYSNWSTSPYAKHKGGARVCMRVYDEYKGGNNNNGTVKMYGNVCINYDKGFWINCNGEGRDSQCDEDAVFKSVEIYDNVVIDPHDFGIYVQSTEEDLTIANSLTFKNNSVILLDKTTGKFVIDNDTFPNFGWTVSGNHFYSTGETPVIDSDWSANMNTQDPELLGEPAVDWDGQEGGTYYMDVNPALHLNPPKGSPIYQLTPILSMDIHDILGDSETGIDQSSLESPTGFQVMTN